MWERVLPPAKVATVMGTVEGPDQDMQEVEGP